jgi:hypothetical protein
LGDQDAICHISRRQSAILGFFHEGKVRMNKAMVCFERIKISLAIALLTALTGCAGYVDGNVGYVGGPVVGGAVVGPVPDAYFYGDFYDHGHDVHAFSNRGFASRGIAHGGVGRR